MAEKIKIRWKEGVGLFVFLVLSGLYFFGFPDFFGILDYKYKYYYEELIVFFSRVVLPAPFLVGVFLYSLYKTEKRTKEGKFSFWRLVVFSLATALITGLVWTLQFIMGSGYSYESFDVVKRLFFDVGIFPVIPMTIAFIFSFVPSLIFYRFKESVKKFHIAIIILFLFVFVGLFGYQQAGDLTCGFNYDGYCVGSKAIKVKDISLCEKVKTAKEFGKYDNYGKNSCYEAISRRWHDVNLCDRIKTISNQKSGDPHYSQYQLHQCVSNIARNTKNKELCEKIPVSKLKYFEFIREKCFNDSDNKLETDLNNWKTYKNEEYGFEFKYPSSLSFSEVKSNDKPRFWVGYEKIKNKLQPEGERAESAGVLVYDNLKDLSIDDFLTYLEENENWKKWSSWLQLNGLVAIKIDGRPSIGIETGTEYENTDIYLKNGVLIYNIYYDRISGLNNLENIFNQIISTFKFTK